MEDKMSCIFLDRDGVLNKSIIKNGKPYAPRFFKDFELLEGINETLKKIKYFNYKIAIFTNQPDVKQFDYMYSEIDKMHNYIYQNLPIDYIDVCFHTDEDMCECRKPKSGMLKRISKKLNIELSSSKVVGDRWSDIKAGQNVGADCFFIDYKYNERRPDGKFTTINKLSDIINYL